MKKIISLLLAFSMALTMLAACTNEPTEIPDEPDTPDVVDPIDPEEPEVPDEPEIVEPTPEYSEAEVGEENTLTNAGTTITLNVIENRLFITNLATTESNVNQLTENSPVALPDGTQDAPKAADKKPFNWKFSSAVKFENKLVNDRLTSGVIYNFDEQSYNLKLRVYCVYRNDIAGPFEFYTEVENLNDTEFRFYIKSIGTFSVAIPEPETTSVFRVKQDGWASDGFRFSATSDVIEGDGIYSTKFSEMENRIVILTDVDNSEDHYMLAEYIDRNGQSGLFYALEWTHGRIATSYDNANTATVALELNYSDAPTLYFNTRIAAKDTLLLPSVYVMPYEGSIDDGSNIFRHWFFESKTVSTLRDNENEPLTGIEYYLAEVHPALSEQLPTEKAAAFGTESVKIDYGWWSGVAFWGSSARPYEGSWVQLADQKDTPGLSYERFKILASEFKENNLNVVLYVLLHETLDTDGNPTEQYGELNTITHPEWFSSFTGDGETKTIDLGNVEVVEFLKEKMSVIFGTLDSGTWRSDFWPIAKSSKNENRHDANGTDVKYWCTVGFGELVDHLYATVDGFRYECCDSGGCSKDLYMATKAVVFNVEDSHIYINLRAAFYDSTYVLNPSQLLMPTWVQFFDTRNASFYPNIPEPVVAEGDEYNFFEAMQDMGYRTTIMGVPKYGDIDDISETYWTKYIDLYKTKVRPLVREAELYHILPRPDGVNWDGMMYADPDSKNEIKGLVFLFKPSEEAENVKNVVFDGLYEEKVYQLTFEDRPEQNCTATGAELMTKGIDVEIKYVGSELIWITEAK